MNKGFSALVTGATGFIGAELIKSLAIEDWEVHAISLHGGKIGNTQVHSLNLCNNEALINFCNNKKVDAIFHLAATVPKTFEFHETKSSFMSNLVSTYNILEAATILKPKVFTFVSSASVYGENSQFLSEQTPVDPNNFYSLGKVTEEMLCEQYRLSNILKTFSLRISSPYGSTIRRTTVLKKFIQLALADKNLKLFGNGERKQDFVHIQDVITALFLTFKYHTKKGGILNIAGGQSVSMKELAELIINQVPNCQSKIEYLLKNDPQSEYKPVFDISKAKSMIKYSPKVRLNQGIASMLNDFKKNSLF